MIHLNNIPKGYLKLHGASIFFWNLIIYQEDKKIKEPGDVYVCLKNCCQKEKKAALHWHEFLCVWMTYEQLFQQHASSMILRILCLWIMYGVELHRKKSVWVKAPKSDYIWR